MVRLVVQPHLEEARFRDVPRPAPVQSDLALKHRAGQQRDSRRAHAHVKKTYVSALQTSPA